MCEMQKLRVSVEQILTAAAEEIFGVFKRSIAEIEEKLNDSAKRNQRLPDDAHQTDFLIAPEQQGRSPRVDQEDPEPPHIKEDQEEEHTMKLTLLSECPTLIRKLWMVKEELPLEQQERSPSLGQVDPEPPHTKEEEDLWTNQEGQQLQGLQEADFTKFPSTLPRVKSEYDEDKARSSQLHQSQTEENTEKPEDRDGSGGSEPDSIQNNDLSISNLSCQTTQHQCTENDKTCKSSTSSETQMTDDTTKPFTCSVCKKDFEEKRKLNKHMIVHIGKKPFSCEICKKGFIYKFKLERHMSVHTGEKPFNCSICKKGFTQKSNLNTHMLLHTGEKPFTCSVCKKGFAQKGNLDYHMILHTGDKPFSCSVCNKVFARKFEVKQHMSVHTGEKPYSCSVCKKGFTQKGNLNKHMLIHRGKKASIH